MRHGSEFEEFYQANYGRIKAMLAAVLGRPLGVVTPASGESGHGAWCGALWANPSGSQALAACGTQGKIIDGRFTPGNLHFPALGLSAGQNFFGW
jgi:hypothetical protein